MTGGGRASKLRRHAMREEARRLSQSLNVSRGTDGDVVVKDGRGVIVASGFDNRGEAEQWIADQRGPQP